MLRSAQIILLLALAALPAAGQPEWTSDGRSSIAVRYASPTVGATSSLISFSGWSAEVAGRIRLSSQTSLLIEVPYASTTVTMSPLFGSGTPTSQTERALGNVSIGLAFEGAERRVSGGVLVTAPTMSDQSTFAGAGATMTNLLRIERFLPKVTVINGGAEIAVGSGETVQPRLRLGGAVWIPSSSIPGGETEVIGEYGAGVSIGGEKVRIAARIDGRIMITGETYLTDSRTLHQASLDASFRLGGLRPGVAIQIPLESGASELVSRALALYLAIQF